MMQNMKAVKRTAITITALAFILLLVFSSCNGEEKGGAMAEDANSTDIKDFYIAAANSPVESQCAALMGDELLSMGYSWDMGIVDPMDEEAFSCALSGGYRAVICVGRDVLESYIFLKTSLPCLYCIVDNSPYRPERELSGICPVISVTDMVKASVTLFGSDKCFSIISFERGAVDVQDACDYLDEAAVDYTVEALGDRGVESGIASAKEKGCDVIIISDGDSIREPISADTGLKTVIRGRGSGALGASLAFSLDTAKIARTMASLCDEMMRGTDSSASREDDGGYYILFINRAVRETLSDSAVGITSESYDIVITE
ncbi:MAG: hypothetical protein E7575_05875 [Ruminococcaceae bacterium]|nr:hypothetical protein [Oscillospiraceae bacterium]